MDTPAATEVDVVVATVLAVVVVGSTVRTDTPLESEAPPLQAARVTAPSAISAARERSLREMTAVTLSDLLGLVVIGAVLVGLLILRRRRVEPHWTSKDGRAFLCRVQELGPDGGPVSGWFEARAKVTGRKVALKARLLTRRSADWDARTVLHRAPDGDSPFAVYLLGGDPELLLRVPQKSDAVAVLDSLVSGESTPE